MMVNLLGPLEAEVCGRSIVPSARKPRKVLALLTANMNSITPISVIMRELWGDHSPASASTTMQTYVLQLRKLIAAACGNDAQCAKAVLATAAGGYAIRGPAESLDQNRFERLAHEGNRRLRVGDDAQAASLFRQALGLWRGEGLLDVELGMPLQAHVIRLEELRIHVLEQCIDAELRLGAHRSLLSELASLTREHRYNETLRTQFMLALYRSSRCADALEIYRQFRTVMIEEIGMEPSARMYQLHQAILVADPRLDDPHVDLGLALHTVVA